MARRRMFSLDVVDTDVFLDMPASSQNLYFHLGMRADDDGFVASPRKITNMVNCSADDLKLLISKGFVIAFRSGVCVITDWKRNNSIQSQWRTPTQFREELNALRLSENGAYSPPDTTLNLSTRTESGTEGTVIIDSVSSNKDSSNSKLSDSTEGTEVTIHAAESNSLSKTLPDSYPLPQCNTNKESIVNSSSNTKAYLPAKDVINKPDTPPSTSSPTITSVLESYGFMPGLESAIKTWLRYTHKKGRNYEAISLNALLTEIQQASSLYGDEAVIKVINRSMANNYLGITFDRIEKIAGPLRDDRLGWIKEVKLE